ncbi:hypothetical protein CHUAL_007239 [Chamberlinius hualienensis]
MSIMTRLRSRLHLFSISDKDNITKPNGPDERTTKSMCILSAILLFPCVARLPSPFLTGCVGVAYILVVLPMLLTGSSIWKWLDVTLNYWKIIKEFIQGYAAIIGVCGQHFLKAKHNVEMGFLKMGNISTLVSQIMFFVMCDRIFCPKERLTSLYSLMFYNVIAYCVAYVKQIVSKEDWSPYVHISKTTSVKHLAMTTTKIVLELTKAVTFIITAVFMLLVFGLEQGLENYHPTWTYLLITATYYLLTEKTFSQNSHRLLEILDLEFLEGLEKLWGPVIVGATIGFISTSMVSLLVFLGYFRLALISSYFNVYLCYKDVIVSSWCALKNERASLAKYCFATSEEVKEMDDVCAVCLQPMRFARVTPCHHMFHGDCLRLCLKESTACPMCKQCL